VLSGKTALVTGGSRGIGRAIALRLAHDGAAVAVGYLERRTAAERVVHEITSMGGRAVALQADISDPQACADLVHSTEQQLGAPDILICNAGVALARLLLDTQVTEWDYLMAVHLRSAFMLSKHALPTMIQRGWGRIVLISSIWGMVGAANEVAYSVAKAGQIGFVRALAKEVARGGITVNAVAPGAVATQMLAGLSAGELDEFAAEVPMGRLGTGEDVAAAVAFLVSPEAGYLSGQVLSPNGAMA
jgi:3-oxoacyl-[acyl-carrier protein] reductase